MIGDPAKLNAILTAMVAPETGGLSPEHARYVLGLNFTPGQHALAAELSAKVRLAPLSRDEQYALDVLLFADDMLSGMQLKARAALQTLQQQPAA